MVSELDRLLDPTGEIEEEGPFSDEEAKTVQSIELMRIYDVLLGIYSALDKPRATALIELHSRGGLLGPLPALNLGDNAPDA